MRADRDDARRAAVRRRAQIRARDNDRITRAELACIVRRHD